MPGMRKAALMKKDGGDIGVTKEGLPSVRLTKSRGTKAPPKAKVPPKKMSGGGMAAKPKAAPMKKGGGAMKSRVRSSCPSKGL